MAYETRTPAETSKKTDPHRMKTQPPTSRTKDKKVKSTPPRNKTSNKSCKKQKTEKAKSPLPKHAKKKSQSPCSSPENPNAGVRPTIFVCYHKLTMSHNHSKQHKKKEHWKIQPCKVTYCGASKCRAWARDLQLAAAASDAAVEKWSKK